MNLHPLGPRASLCFDQPIIALIHQPLLWSASLCFDWTDCYNVANDSQQAGESNVAADPYALIDPYQPTFQSDHTAGPQPIANAIASAVGAQLGEGLSFFGLSADVPPGFRMHGRSIPGLTLEIHRKGRSRTAGASHDRAATLSTGVATTIFTDQPEDWETRAGDHDSIELFSILTDMDWLERADLIPAGKGALTHLAIGYAPVDPGILRALPVSDGDDIHTPVTRLFLEGVVLQLLGQSLGRLISGDSRIIDAATNQRARRARDYIVSLPIDKLGIVSAAAALGTSPRQLQRDFLTVFGEGPVTYARRFQLMEAAAKIRSGSLTVVEAAFDAGYSSTGTFSRALFNTLGVRPRDLKARSK